MICTLYKTWTLLHDKMSVGIFSLFTLNGGVQLFMFDVRIYYDEMNVKKQLRGNLIIFPSSFWLTGFSFFSTFFFRRTRIFSSIILIPKNILVVFFLALHSEYFWFFCFYFFYKKFWLSFYIIYFSWIHFSQRNFIFLHNYHY